MANQEQLDLLKQGVEVWNQWRQGYPEKLLDLNRADLFKAHLRGANLRGGFMRGTDLRGTNLQEADLEGANLLGVDLSYAFVEEANLRGVNLKGAKLRRANLRGVDLRGADLQGADLQGTDLIRANLVKTDLTQANLSETALSGANLSEAIINGTIFASIDLRETRGLVKLHHAGPSAVAMHTIQLPQDGSALHFLRGVGVSDEWIDFYRAQILSPIHYYSCFISYSNKDEMFARRLHADLQEHGVRCWFAPKDLKIGDRIRARIDEAIHLHEKLLLLLSEHALASAWVEDEVEAALEKERRQQREVLFPLRLDESVLQTSQAWAKQLRRTRHIGDFTQWTDPQQYQRAFVRLLFDLKTENNTKGEADGKPGDRSIIGTQRAGRKKP
jgi:hypothetical protein